MSLSESNAAPSSSGQASKPEAGRSKSATPVRLIRAGNEDITIGENSVLEGSFETQGAMFVDGAAVNADLNAAQLSIGATGRVEGQASVLRAEIAGAFEGTLECSGEVILRSSSRIAGEVRCAKLVTHRGAVIDAQVRVVSDGEDGPEERSPQSVAIVQTARGSSLRPWTRRRFKRVVPAMGGAALSLCLVGIGALVF
ncbi:polymer-forming cytoskeletal protein [Parvibaculum sp.]|uniref:bactofilin family protein n=1 Tax=Parvibaculum sp. TaxID=2024848 RepID=UPI001B15786F|nr:polymer-forming cytoskeletal protein [Parvibaculum sp.]MBO6668015.1 polymer-forming cytoskeletal protein [Parvibaculum sp.]MBO6693339.1 polymer-forming cytoskeletal protein [Parvibaculum sp.]MBO6714749.1 polymer-forming cytoskeletal protein [Parvibaculum sp.]